jgi:catalase
VTSFLDLVTTGRRTAVLGMLGLLLTGCSDYALLQPGEERMGGDEPQIAAAMIDAIKTISLERYPAGTMKRFNQAKSLGCLNADFHVPEDQPGVLRQGLFARPGHYPAQIRFANASSEDDRNRDLHGMSIKVSGVAGEPLWGEAGSQDFLLNSYPVLFAGTPDEFLAFLQAQRDHSMWKFFINPANLDSLWILFQAREKITSPLDIGYWSTTPYRFGSDPAVAVKYAVQPCSTLQSTLPDAAGADYLSRALQQHLAQAPACFDFMVQFQSDPQAMPIEDASVIWDEAAAPLQKVARITIEQQDFAAGQKRAECERLTFNPWQSLAEHRPLGGINRLRKPVYGEIADFRNSQNSQRLSHEP